MLELGLKTACCTLMFALSLATAGCTQIEGSAATATASSSGPVAENHTAIAGAAAPAPSATLPRRQDLATFAESLGRKFDRSRESRRAASPEGGTLNIPNGHVAHASVLVRGADGKLHSACVSSASEISALVRRVQAGGGQ